MARARNIKPGFFKNEQLAECDPLARILFEGLWCEADREGRLEDRPKRLKAEILPYDNCDIEALLGQLADRGFIVRYCVAGQALIQVSTFTKHQNPHMREPASSLPAPDQHCASTVLAPDKHQSGPADSGFLIPDSGFQREAAQAPTASPSARPPERGTRLAEGWQPPDDLLAWASTERPGLDVATELAAFRDFWRAKPGKDGRKLDWPATFRNWIRNARARPRAGPSGERVSEVMRGVHRLEEMKREIANRGRLAPDGNPDGTAEARLAAPGQRASG